MYGQAHTETIPTVETTVGPDYAEQINACIEEIRDTLDAKVTPAGIDLNANLDFLNSATYRAAVNIERANFQNKGALISSATYPTALFVKSGELYYNDAAGLQVQLTNAGAVNITGTGGITGTGYGTGSVEVNWSAADGAYKLKSGAGANDYAHAWLDDIYLNDDSGNFLRVGVGAMASDYTLTLPAAVPASTLPLLMDTSGVVTTSGTLANLVAITTSGAAVIGTTLGVTGLITADGGLTAGAADDITVSALENFRFADASINLHCSEFAFDPTEWTMDHSAEPNGGVLNNPSGLVRLWIPITQPIGYTFTSAQIYVQAANVNTLTATLTSMTFQGVKDATATTDVSVTGGGTQDDTLLLNPADFKFATGVSWFIELQASAADANLGVYMATINYKSIP